LSTDENEAPPSKERSALMAKVRGKNTTPEIKVRKILHAMGLRFRLHRRDLPGSPDIVLPRHKIAIFVHGCFWHRHDSCRLATSPKTRKDFWQGKFDANLSRDRRNEAALRASGWTTATIWECETKKASPEMIKRSLLQAVPSLASGTVDPAAERSPRSGSSRAPFDPE
jgi:DNA mismatch endonuclease (patch repair protein)